MKKIYSLLAGIICFSMIVTDSYGQLASSCTPSPTSTNGRITNVSSSGAISNISNSTGANYYSNYTATQQIQALPGTSFNLSVTSDWYFGTYIDWDNNGTIGAGDYSVVDRSTTGTRTSNFTVNVPSTATPGMKRLRVNNTWSQTPGYCVTHSSGYGECEDYTVEVLTPATEDAALAGTPTVNVCSGLNDFNVVVKNFGSNTLTSFTISGSINDGSTTTNFGPIVISGASLAFTEDTIVSLGSYTYASGTSYSLNASVSSPNGTTDGRPTNNSWSNSGLQPAMSGTFTVGTGTSDYSNINAALSDLRSLGVCDTVIMNIAAGTYSDRWYLSSGTISGTSSLSPVIWQTDPSTVTPADPTATYRYSGEVIEFRNSGHEYQIFRNMTLESSSTSGDIVYYSTSGNGNHSWFDNIIFNGATSTTTSTAASIIYAFGGDNVHVTNCEFNRGSHAIYESGGSTWTIQDNTINPKTGNALELRGGSHKIMNNIIEANTSTGTDDNVYVQGGNSIITGNRIKYSNAWGSAIYSGGAGDSIAGNYIELSTGHNNGCYGIEGRGANSYIHNNEIIVNNVRGNVYIIYASGNEMQITNNNIVLQSTSGNGTIRGIYTLGDGTVSNRSIIANNLINFMDPSYTGTGYGIYGSNTPYTDYMHNTVVMDGIGNYYPGYIDMLNNTNNHTVRNNIFVNKSNQGAAIFMDRVGAADNNVYYTNSNMFGRFNFSNYNTFAAWKTASNFDANSIEHLPDFFSPTNLKIFYDQVINDLGAPSSIMFDYEGESRDPLNPDPGADEYQIPFNSVSLTSIDGPMNPICALSNQVMISVANIGIGSLNTFDVGGTIYHKNGTTTNLPLFNYNAGTIASKGTKSLTTHTISIPTGFEDGDSIVVFVDNPNNIGAGQDTITKDDTLWVKMIKGLQGVYTVGSSMSADFNTIAEVSHLLDSNDAICDTVIFNIEDGMYGDVLTINDLLGSDATKPVIFRSISEDRSMVTIGDGSGGLVANNGQNYYFENITFENTGSNGRVVELNDDIENVHFDMCAFNNMSTTNTGTNATTFYASGNIDNISIRNSLISEGSYGVYVSTVGGVAALKGAEIIDCEFTNQYRDGIYLNNGYEVKVWGNTFESNSSYNSANAIYSNGLTKGAQFIGNQAVSQSNWPRYGLAIYNADALANAPVLVENNAFKQGNPSTAQNLAGIYSSNSNYLTITNNTFAVDGTSGNTWGAYFTGGGGIKLKNNIFANFGQGECLYINGASNVTYSDYNNLYSPIGDFAYFNVAVGDMNAWQTVATFDQNSQNVDPMFYSGIDFHVCNIDLDGMGQPNSGITYDIDGEMRNATPDIGADEFQHPSQFSLGADTTICKGDDVTLNARLNAGSTTLWNNFQTTQTITVNQAGIYSAYVTNVCGTSIDSIEVMFSNPAALGSDTTVCDANGLTLDAGVSNAVRYAWSNGANTQTINVSKTGQYAVELEDNIGCVSQDTIDVYVSPQVDLGADTMVCSGNTLTLDGNVGPGSYRWNDLDRNPVKFVSKKGTYSLVFVDTKSGCISEDSVNINIMATPQAQYLWQSKVNGVSFTNTSLDGTTYAWDFGDNTTSTKMNPAHTYSNPGTYIVLLTATNACGSHTIEQEVTVSGFVSVEEAALANSLSVYPNPNNGSFTVNLANVESKDVIIVLMDAQGKVVYDNTLSPEGNSVETTIDVALATGMYNLHITANGATSVSKVSIIK